MPNCRREWRVGGTYFFTLNLLQRSGNDLLVRHIDLLREAREAWIMRSKHAAQYASLLTPYKARLAPYPRCSAQCQFNRETRICFHL